MADRPTAGEQADAERIVRTAEADAICCKNDGDLRWTNEDVLVLVAKIRSQEATIATLRAENEESSQGALDICMDRLIDLTNALDAHGRMMIVSNEHAVERARSLVAIEAKHAELQARLASAEKVVEAARVLTDVADVRCEIMARCPSARDPHASCTCGRRDAEVTFHAALEAHDAVRS